MQDSIDIELIKALKFIYALFKWSVLQILLIYLFPVVWGNCLNTELLVFLLLYTTIYTIYWRTVSNNDKFIYLPFPYIIYIVILSATCLVVSDISFLFLSLLPLDSCCRLFDFLAL